MADIFEIERVIIQLTKQSKIPLTAPIMILPFLEGKNDFTLSTFITNILRQIILNYTWLESSKSQDLDFFILQQIYYCEIINKMRNYRTY